jgi:hypothetical protein
MRNFWETSKPTAENTKKSKTEETQASKSGQRWSFIWLNALQFVKIAPSIEGAFYLGVFSNIHGLTVRPYYATLSGYLVF